jgi:hypothetical protein
MPLKCSSATKWDRLLLWAAGMALFVRFVFLVRGGLTSWFDDDDLMNLTTYWLSSWPALLKANLVFWSSFYRPAGGLFYRTLYGLWGFHPLPFHIAVLVLLSIDFALLALTVWQLTGSRWGVLLALAVLGINPAFGFAYFNMGNIYDILAYVFFWCAFSFYVYLRRAGRLPGWGAMALLFGLFVLALNAKEISVSLPLAVGLYEILWHSPANWRVAELWRWITREGRFAAIGALADLAYVIGKAQGSNSLWLKGPYHPHYSAAAYLESLSHYVSQLIYYPVTISAAQAAGLLLAMLVVAVALRRHCLLWAVGFIAVGVLPLAFIPGRGGAGYLVPSVGWAVYLGGFLDWLGESIGGRRLWLRWAVQGILVGVLAVKLAPWQRASIELHAKVTHEMQNRYRRYMEQIRALIPSPRKGARILLLSDAEGRDDYDAAFVICLYYGDPKLEVTRMTLWNEHNVQVDPSSYDFVLDWTDNRFVLVHPHTYDDFDHAIVFNGPWVRDRVWPLTHAHTVTYCNLPGSDVRFAFQGEFLTYVYTKAANRGEADVAIDGLHRTTLDLYSAKTEWQSRTTFKVDPGEHHAVITVLADKNPKSSDRFVDVDAFQVH